MKTIASQSALLNKRKNFIKTEFFFNFSVADVSDVSEDFKKLRNYCLSVALITRHSKVSIRKATLVRLKS